MKRRKKNSITKEIIILLLLIIIILLIMIVALYDFRPSNVMVPETIPYSSDSKTKNVKQEINYTNDGDMTADGDVNTGDNSENNPIGSTTYNVDEMDLNVYKEKNLYISGNSNPFEYVQEETSSQTTNGVSGSSNPANQSNSATAQNGNTTAPTNSTTAQNGSTSTQNGSATTTTSTTEEQTTTQPASTTTSTTTSSSTSTSTSTSTTSTQATTSTQNSGNSITGTFFESPYSK